MGVFSFIKSLKAQKTASIHLDPNEYIPVLWEDDYCQVEIIPIRNEPFIREQLNEISELSSQSTTKFGFDKSFERGTMPFPTLTEEIRIDYLEPALAGFNLPKARFIRYEANKIIDFQNSKTKAFGFSNFTIFFDNESEFVKNIWLSMGLIVSAPQFELIKSVLCDLGETNQLLLIDWNSLELIDLSNKREVDKYLMGYFK